MCGILYKVSSGRGFRNIRKGVRACHAFLCPRRTSGRSALPFAERMRITFQGRSAWLSARRSRWQMGKVTLTVAFFPVFLQMRYTPA